MPEHFASIGEAIGSAMRRNTAMAADLAAARRLADQPTAAAPTPSGGVEDSPRYVGAPQPGLDNAALRHLVDRAARGVSSTDEGQRLRDGVEHLLRRVATLEHVAAGNRRHVQLIAPELERAEAALARVRTECEAIEAERPRVDESFGDGMADAAARIRCALDGPADGE